MFMFIGKKNDLNENVLFVLQRRKFIGGRADRLALIPLSI